MWKLIVVWMLFPVSRILIEDLMNTLLSSEFPTRLYLAQLHLLSEFTQPKLCPSDNSVDQICKQVLTEVCAIVYWATFPDVAEVRLPPAFAVVSCEILYGLPWPNIKVREVKLCSNNACDNLICLT